MPSIIGFRIPDVCLCITSKPVRVKYGAGPANFVCRASGKLRLSCGVKISTDNRIRILTVPHISGAALDLKKFACEREEVKAAIVRFLKAKGFSATVAARTSNKSTLFVSHIVALLQTHYKERSISGDEPTSNEIQSEILPLLESLFTKHGSGFVDALLAFPTEMQPIKQYTMDERVAHLNLEEYPNLLRHVVDGNLPPAISYFFSLKMSPQQLEELLHRFPSISGFSVEGKIKHVESYLLSLGVPSSDIPRIIMKRPQLFGCSVIGNLKPTVEFLEDVGVDKEKWGRILASFPHMLTYSRPKLQHCVEFLLHIGFSSSRVGKVLTRFPHVVGYSLDGKLKPMALYFESIGIKDVSLLVMRSPQTLGLSLEKNIKPTVEFLVRLGYTVEEVVIVINRFPQLLGLSIQKNLLPKWEFFIVMDRRKAELIEFPQYFGYSLEKRIKSRYEILEEKGCTWTLNRMLSTTDTKFLVCLQKHKELSQAQK